MRHLTLERALLVGAVIVAILAIVVGVGTNRASAGPIMVARGNPRCNNDVAGDLERQVRSDDRNVPGSDRDALAQRYSDLDSVVQQAQSEDEILGTQCTTTTLTPIQNQIAGVIAWAYVLQSDIAAKGYTNCPAAAKAVPASLLAGAWYALATTLNAYTSPAPTASPTTAPLVKEVMPKVRARAPTYGLALPAIADTSEYWRDGINTAAKTAIAGCAPSPQPSASPRQRILQTIRK